MASAAPLRTVFARYQRYWRQPPLFLLAFLWAGAGSAQAPQDDCSIALNALLFGNYDPLETLVPLDRTTSINVSCNRATDARIEFSTGQSGSYGARTMRLGASALRYNLYLDAAHSIILGDGSASSVPILGRFNNGSDTITLYARVPPGQDPAVGHHVDTIIVTMTF